MPQPLRTNTNGIPCPECGNTQRKVVDSRPVLGVASIRRRCVCPNGHRYTTREHAEHPPEAVDYQI